MLCWKNGQRSPIHDHTGSSCGVRVLRGTLTETLFELAPNGHVKAVARADFAAGQSDRQRGHRHAPGVELAGRRRRPGDAARLLAAALAHGHLLADRRTRGEEVLWPRNARSSPPCRRTARRRCDSVHGWVTPTRLFFVRNHFAVPAIDLATVAAARRGPRRAADRAWTWDELMDAAASAPSSPPSSAPAMAARFCPSGSPACSGGPGAIGHAEWTGVPLHAGAGTGGH